MSVDQSPRVIIFDVNETLSDLAPLAAAFEREGLPGHAARLWFTRVLRDGFALTAARTNPRFADLATENLRSLLADRADLTDAARPDADAVESHVKPAVEPAVGRIMDAFGSLEVHADVPEGLNTLHRAGHRLATLSNGAAAEALLGRSGLRHLFEHVLTVEQAPAWKPDPAAYRYGTAACGVRDHEALLVAVHPWDIDGAARAGLRTAWVRRSASHYPEHFTAPDFVVEDVRDLADTLSALLPAAISRKTDRNPSENRED